MRVLVSGATGLIGRALIPVLQRAGHQVIGLQRAGGAAAATTPSTATWDPATGQVEVSGPIDAVVHLAGETIAQRWTASVKQRLRASRVDATQRLCTALAARPQPPPVFLAASAVGYYGAGGDEWLTETSPMGRGFLAELCRDWEEAADPLRTQGTRVVSMRLGVVLSAQGGAMARMLPPARFGLGGPFGSGQQFWSWILINDLLSAIRHLLETTTVSGPVNLVGPHPVRQVEFARALGRVLHRPAWVSFPAWVARLVWGQMAEEVLLTGARVRPTRLVESGFSFGYGGLDAALRQMVGSATPRRRDGTEGE